MSFLHILPFYWFSIWVCLSLLWACFSLPFYLLVRHEVSKSLVLLNSASLPLYFPHGCHHISHCCLACCFQVKIFKLGDLCGEKTKAVFKASKLCVPFADAWKHLKAEFFLYPIFENPFPRFTSTRFTNQNNTFTLSSLWALIEVHWLTGTPHLMYIL